MTLNKYKIGQLIEQIQETNEKLEYKEKDVMGMTITKTIIPTKADTSNADLRKYIIIKPNEFVYNPRTHGKKIGLGFNNTDKAIIISWNNIGFKIRKEMLEIIDPYYLFINFNRNEWDREACYQSWGSSTEVFSWYALCDMEIELPNIEIQKKYVAIYKAMLENQKSYERGLEDLKVSCIATIEKLKQEYEMISILPFLEERTEINKCVKYKDLVGVGNDGFITPRGSREESTFNKCNIFYPKDFVYNPSVISKGAIAYNSCFKEPRICTEEYIVFLVKDEKVLSPEYLYLWLKRKETGRYMEFMNIDSVRNRVYFKDLENIKIPIPDIIKQKSIANIYNAYNKRKEINEKLKEQIKNICPILIKGSLEEAKSN